MMRYLNHHSDRYVSTVDLLNWLMVFAIQLETGVHPGSGEAEGQLVWNIIAALVEFDLTARVKDE